MTLNPLIGLYFNLSGRWRNNLMLVGGVVAVVGFGVLLQYRAGGGRLSAVTGTWTMLLSLFQLIALLILGPTAIRKAITRDFQTGMIESHRLTPMSNAAIVTGYLLGPMINSLTLFGTGVVLGAALSAAYAYDTNTPQILTAWYLGQCGLVILAFLYGAFTLMTAVAGSGKANTAGLMVLIGIVGASIFQFVPGLKLLTGAYAIMSAFPRGPGRPIPTGAINQISLLLAPALQVVLGLLFLRAACRKVRAPQEPLFDVKLAAALLVICIGTLVAGVHVMGEIPSFAPPGAMPPEIRQVEGIAAVVVSLGLYMLIAQLLLLGGAADGFALRRAQLYEDAPRNAGPRLLLNEALPWVAGGSAILLLLLLARTTPAEYQGQAIARLTSNSAGQLIAAGSLLLSMLADYYFLRVVVALGRKPLAPFIVYFGTAKLAPLVIEACVLSVSNENDPVFGAANFAAISPIGLLAAVMLNSGQPLAGLGVQGLIAGVMFAWSLSATRRALQTAPGAGPVVARPVA